MSQKLIHLGKNERIDSECKEVLSLIRKTYGNTTQILVSNEELCELAAVCAKFPRYNDPEKARSELHSAAIDEVADVMIILDHVINIFQLDDLEIRARIQGKIDRIRRWLSKSSNQEQTTVDREVREGENPQPEEKPAEKPVEQSESDVTKVHCVGCAHVGKFQQLKIGGRCNICAQNNWQLWESKEAPGVGKGTRSPEWIRRGLGHEAGTKVSKEDFMLLLLRAERHGKEFPDECLLHIFPNHKGLRFPLEDYGKTWEALWA